MNVIRTYAIVIAALVYLFPNEIDNEELMSLHETTNTHRFQK